MQCLHTHPRRNREVTGWGRDRPGPHSHHTTPHSALTNPLPLHPRRTDTAGEGREARVPSSCSPSAHHTALQPLASPPGVSAGLRGAGCGPKAKIEAMRFLFQKPHLSEGISSVLL